MKAFQALVPPLYQVNGKTVPPGETQVMYHKDPNTPASLDFYRYPSCTPQQVGGKIKREKLEFLCNVGK